MTWSDEPKSFRIAVIVWLRRQSKTKKHGSVSNFASFQQRSFETDHAVLGIETAPLHCSAGFDSHVVGLNSASAHALGAKHVAFSCFDHHRHSR